MKLAAFSSPTCGGSGSRRSRETMGGASPLRRSLRARLASAVCAALVACVAGCAQPARAELMHLADMPTLESGRVPEDCALPVEDQDLLQDAEHRCLVFSRNEGDAFVESYVQALRARGWTRGGVGGSSIWVFIPMQRDCAQVYSITVSDWPRGSQTTETSEIVLDFILEQRMRCGEELEAP